MTWDINASTGEITATLDHVGIVHSAYVWWGYSCGVNAWDNNKFRRDFRVAHLDNPCTCGIYAEGYCSNLKAVMKKQELTVTTVNGRRTLTAHVDPPGDGKWVAYFIDIKYVNKNAFPFDIMELYDGVESNIENKNFGGPHRKDHPNFGGFDTDFGRFFEFTTQVSVFPNTFPYPDCSGVECGNRIL